MKVHAIIGFNHGVLGLAENPALGPGFFRQNTSGYALGVLTPKASPSGWVFSQAQHPMIKTYNHAYLCHSDLFKQVIDRCGINLNKHGIFWIPIMIPVPLRER